MILVTTHKTPIIELTTKTKNGGNKVDKINLEDFIDVKGGKVLVISFAAKNL